MDRAIAANVLRVPASALFRVGEDWNVFVMSGGIAKSRRVEIGHRNALYVEIEGGVQMGEIIVLHPSNDIKDGVSIKTRPQ